MKYSSLNGTCSITFKLERIFHFTKAFLSLFHRNILFIYHATFWTENRPSKILHKKEKGGYDLRDTHGGLMKSLMKEESETVR